VETCGRGKKLIGLMGTKNFLGALRALNSQLRKAKGELDPHPFFKLQGWVKEEGPSIQRELRGGTFISQGRKTVPD